MNSPIINIILPLIGLGILVLCMLSFFFRYGDKLKGKTQKIKGFGVDMEVSVLTVFILVGILLSFSGVYLRVKDYEKNLEAARNKEKAAKQALEQARKMEMKMFLVLEGVDESNAPKLEDLHCEYFLSGEDEPTTVDVTRGYSTGHFKAILKEMSCKDHIALLVLEDQVIHRKWVKRSFMPFEPEHLLTKE